MGKGLKRKPTEEYPDLPLHDAMDTALYCVFCRCCRVLLLGYNKGQLSLLWLRIRRSGSWYLVLVKAFHAIFGVA